MCIAECNVCRCCRAVCRAAQLLDLRKVIVFPFLFSRWYPPATEGQTERERERGTDGSWFRWMRLIAERRRQTDRHWLYLINFRIDQKLRLSISGTKVWTYRKISLCRMCGVLCDGVLMCWDERERERERERQLNNHVDQIDHNMNNKTM